MLLFSLRIGFISLVRIRLVCFQVGKLNVRVPAELFISSRFLGYSQGSSTFGVTTDSRCFTRVNVRTVTQESVARFSMSAFVPRSGGGMSHLGLLIDVREKNPCSRPKVASDPGKMAVAVREDCATILTGMHGSELR